MAAHKKLERRVIQQSAYLVAYLYFAFCGPENQQYFYAKNRGLPLLDLPSRETAAYILESIDTLPEREQLILKRTLEDQTLADKGPSFFHTGSPQTTSTTASARRARA